MTTSLTGIMRQWRSIRRRRRPAQGTAMPAERYAIISIEEALTGDFPGWHADRAAALQQAAFEPVLQRMYAGQPRQDFLAAAQAVRATGIHHPALVEIGCGNGYYSEILGRLVEGGVRYTGVDFSPAMIQSAQQRYPRRPFLVGDGQDLPLADGSFDITFSSTALMHMPRFDAAIAEARRVARQWCIFHTVPVVRRRPTTFLRHEAYGGVLVEVLFNGDELRAAFDRAGLRVRSDLPGIPYNLEAVIGEPTEARTYLCEVTP